MSRLARHDQTRLDILLHRHGAEDLTALRHIGDALGDALMARECCDIGAVHHDLAGARRHDADQRFHQRRFAHAVAADERDDLALRDREIDAVQDLALAIGGRQIANIEHGIDLILLKPDPLH